MESIKIVIEGCPENVLVASTLHALDLFNQEMLKLKNLVDEKQKEIEELLSRIEGMKSEIRESTESYKSELGHLTAEQNRLKDEMTQMEESERSLQGAIQSLKNEIESMCISHNDEMKKKESAYAEELENINGAFAAQIDELKLENEKIVADNKKIMDQLKAANNMILVLLMPFIREIADAIHNLLNTMEDSPVKEWIENILKKGEESELKGIESILKIEDLNLLIRNLSFENSSFCQLATLLMWGSIEPVKEKISLSYNWAALQTAYDKFLGALNALGYNVSYPENHEDIEWLENAEGVVNKSFQDKFVELFGPSLPLEKGVPIFITALSLVSAEVKKSGNFVKYWKAN